MLPDKQSSLFNKIIKWMKKFRSSEKTCWKDSADTTLRNGLLETTKQNNQKFVCIYGHIKTIWIITDPSEIT